ncbi:MAG: excinuclease ABC subunit UvrA [Verrucomicrobia bacterium]|nr:excinuclease ABC subunit UvrA [Verrucomicrobiota bacterium]
MPDSVDQSIRLRGVRQNNLKDLNLDLPLGKLIVVTGLSGTGKSSLVFDTLHAEGQRRYVETFSAYTRQFMEMLDRPKVDTVENIRPSIAIEQGNTVKTSRSTVGTMTELCDYFKVWFAHMAELLDPVTGKVIQDDNPSSIWRQAMGAYAGQTVLLTFSCPLPGNMQLSELVQPLKAQGYSRAVAGGAVVKLDALLQVDTVVEGRECIVVQDRLVLAEKNRDRFLDSARTALHFGQGKLQLHADTGTLLQKFSEGLHSPDTGRVFRPASPNLFSFNSPVGACPRCRGFGRIIEVDYRLVIPDPSVSLADGAIRAFSGEVYSECKDSLVAACKRRKIPVHKPWSELSDEQKQFVVEGDPDYRESHGHENEAITEPGGGGKWYGIRRFFDWLESNTYKMHVRVFLSRYRSYVTCPDCGGTRLQPEALNWKWRGYTLPDLYVLPVDELLSLLRGTLQQQSGSHQLQIAAQAIQTRLSYLQAVGLGYLTLDRSSRTLSGGETQRVNLTACLGTALVDTLFVLDEPSVGLHARDIHRLIGILRSLTEAGNTVVVVEHDEAIMAAADWLIELGPEPGKEGGHIVAMGPLSEVMHSGNCMTARYLRGEMQVVTRPQTRPVTKTKTPWLRIKGARKHNLRGLDIALPLQRLVVVTGVSGSGKSTLLNNVLYQVWLAQTGKACEDPAAVDAYAADKEPGDVILVDQSPVSKTPRSNPALFVDVWDSIRDCFGSTAEAFNAGLSASHFSFNSASGRCPNCQGLGFEKVEMQFMADLYLPCPVCEGRRFRPEVLQVSWRGYTVDQVLRLTVAEARQVFAHNPKVVRNLGLLCDVGLDYLPLGQPLNTLSGGEAQRLKLVRFLEDSKHVDNALILIDEPTTGLHRHDVVKLLALLHRLVDEGNSVVLIEHQLDVIASADWIVELGPEAGAGGGNIVFSGTPDQLRRSDTATAPFMNIAGRGDLVREEAGTVKHATAPARRVMQLTGAREHNLKNLNLDIPPWAKMTVVTGDQWFR